MKAKPVLCFALLLSAGFILSFTGQAGVIASTNSSVITINSPQDSVELPKLGHAIFADQSSGFSLQVPVGFQEIGKKPDTNNPVLQAWLLRTDGTAIAQSGEPSIIMIGGGFGNYSTDYMFYQFSKVPVNELSGVVVSLNGKLFCHEIERSNGELPAPGDGVNILQISPTNISDSPISVQVTNADSSEWFTVFYKTDKTAGKLINGCLEVSDAGSIVSSEPVEKIPTASGVRFNFNVGYVWPFKFKIIDATQVHEAGYWFYLRDFATNISTVNAEKTVKSCDARMGDIIFTNFNVPVSFTEQPTQFTVQLAVATYRDDEKHSVPRASELHRQVWLLRSDGTAISPLHKPLVGGTGNGGYSNFYLIFTFPRKPTDEIAGIATSVNGKLYCRELPSEWNKP